MPPPTTRSFVGSVLVSILCLTVSFEVLAPILSALRTEWREYQRRLQDGRFASLASTAHMLRLEQALREAVRKGENLEERVDELRRVLEQRVPAPTVADEAAASGSASSGDDDTTASEGSAASQGSSGAGTDLPREDSPTFYDDADGDDWGTPPNSEADGAHSRGHGPQRRTARGEAFPRTARTYARTGREEISPPPRTSTSHPPPYPLDIPHEFRAFRFRYPPRQAHHLPTRRQSSKRNPSPRLAWQQPQRGWGTRRVASHGSGGESADSEASACPVRRRVPGPGMRLPFLVVHPAFASSHQRGTQALRRPQRPQPSAPARRGWAQMWFDHQPGVVRSWAEMHFDFHPGVVR